MFDELKRYTQKGYVYVLRNENGLIKIGITNNPHTRINSIVHSSGVNIDKYYISNPLRNNDLVEERAHKHFKKQRTYGEWFIDCDFDKVVTVLKQIISNCGIETCKNNLVDCEWGYNLDNGDVSNYSVFDLVNILTPMVYYIEDEMFKLRIIEAIDNSLLSIEMYTKKEDWLMRSFGTNGIKACIRSILKYYGVNDLLDNDESIDFYKETIGLMKFEEAKQFGVKLRKF